jgi:predicted small lipoprotein YifL
MRNRCVILVRHLKEATRKPTFGVFLLAGAAVGLVACGQPGALYLPTEPASVNRATLPQTLLPGTRTNQSTSSGSQPTQPAQPAQPILAASAPK